MTYVIDYFNIFSDFREIYYKKKGVDFHLVKHTNLKTDTDMFFKIFFTVYAKHTGLDLSRDFVFIVKKLHGYQDILKNVLESYNMINIRFMLVIEKYNNKIVDSNKDDFLCQYMMCLYGNDSVLISNDKYADTRNYLDAFLGQKTLNIQTLMNRGGLFTIHSCPFIITDKTISSLLKQRMNRSSIPKQNLLNVIGNA
jgi:hypothetical protein